MEVEEKKVGPPEQEEVDLASILFDSGEIDNDDEVGQYGDDDGEENLDTLRDRLHKRNKHLRKAKEAQKRTQQELETVLSRYDQLEQRLARIESGGNSHKETTNWADEISADPGKVTDYITGQMTSLEDRFEKALELLHRDITGKLSKVDPKRNQYQPIIERLREDDRWANFSDDQLLAVAEALSSRKLKVPRGSIGGKRVVESAKEIDPVEAAKADKELMRKLGYE